MIYLIFINWLRESWIWFADLSLLCLAGSMVWASRIQLSSWKKKAIRVAGTLLLLPLATFSLLVVAFALGVPPGQHLEFSSKSGVRSALVSHSETRDSSATLVTVGGRICCSRHIAYEYYGDGEDFVGTASLVWVDDHHLTIEYAVDTSQIQHCYAHAGDVEVLCKPEGQPTFGSKD